MKMGGWVVYFPETLLSPVSRGDAWFILEVNFVAELFIILPLHVVIFSYAMLLLRIFHIVMLQGASCGCTAEQRILTAHEAWWSALRLRTRGMVPSCDRVKF